MAWIYLFTASAAEIVWAYTLKASDGFTKPLWAGINLVTMLGTVWFLAQAVRTLPLGTAYAVWTGVGVVGAAVLGVVMLGENVSPMRLGAIALILAGVVMLKVAEG